MNVQRAAYDILKEKNRPMSSREIAEIILKRKLIPSNAKDPVFSLATTIDKNIRGEIYNDPKLILVSSERGHRLIGLPSWKNSNSIPKVNSLELREVKLRIPQTLIEKIQLATQSKIEDSFDETVITILKKGLLSLSSEIKAGLVSQLNKFDEL